MKRPVVFGDLPADAFPFTITFTDTDTREVLDTMTIDGPGAINIPGWAPRRVAVDVVFANGARQHMEPPA